MKKILTLFALVGLLAFSSCTGPQGPPGVPGSDGQDGLLSEVFELRNVNFGYDVTNGFSIYQKLIPKIYPGDVILIYRLSGTIDSNTPIWQSIPRTLYLSQGEELDYDYDFSQEDFTIYAGGNFDLSLTPQYLNNQTFRIVIVPGNLNSTSARKKFVDLTDYNAVIKAYNIDDSKVKVLN